MNRVPFYDFDIGRQLYQKTGLVEEEHVTQYGNLMDPNLTWIENLLCHEYTECYLHYSCFYDESDPQIKKIWEQHFLQEVAHLHWVADLLKKYEGKEWQQVIPGGKFPELLKLGPNVEYVRDILKSTANNTSYREEYPDVSQLPKNAEFFKIQNVLNALIDGVPLHKGIKFYIMKNGQDYRFETSPNPINELQCRTKDNVSVGR